VTLVPTREGTPYLEVQDRRGYGCWRLMVRIADTRTYKSLSEIPDPAQRLHTAEQAGGGLALFGTLGEGIDVANLASPLPGFRDTRVYYDQLLSVLAGNRTLEQAERFLPADPEVRQSTQQHFLLHLPEEERLRRLEHPDVRPYIELLREQEDHALLLVREMAAGRIRRGAIHGDTKLENFLFDAATGQVKSLVDLDTIMPHTWLADWGDMVRSLCNVAGEKEPDRAKIQVDLPIYRAVATGFLRSARNVTRRELELLVDSVESVALELGMRFLTDYLRGDSYFKLGPADPADLNKIRGLGQLALFQRLRAAAPEARACVEGLRQRFGVMGIDEGRA
jgi:Phosphotransferase enzyme family